MKILAELRARGQAGDMQAVLDSIPYARFLGMQVDCKGSEVTTILPFQDKLIGNVNLPAYHGGVIGSLLEFTALVQLLYDTSCERLPKTIDLSIDYLRSAGPLPIYGRALVTRHGRRVANVRVEAWQQDRHKPVAGAHGHFLLAPLATDRP